MTQTPMPMHTDPNETVQRHLVWRGWLRLAHWSMAAGTLALLFTGWLIANAPSVADHAVQDHYLAAYLLLGGLGLRLWLLLRGGEVERFKTLLPDLTRTHVMKDMVRFYISFGRMPLPRWYAHNPLWGPVYLLLLLALVMVAATGFAQQQWPIVYGFYLPSMHRWWADAIGLFVIAHLLAVVLHDWKGTACDVSAMLSGYRIFVIKRIDPEEIVGTQRISVEQIERPSSRDPD